MKSETWEGRGNAVHVSVTDLTPIYSETDTRILVHLCHAPQKRVLIKTVDTDVVVIALAHFLDLEIDEIWVEFGAGKKKRH